MHYILKIIHKSNFFLIKIIFRFEILIDPKYANEEVFLNVNAFQIYEVLEPSLTGIDTLQ